MTLSHEFRAPLSSILMILEGMLQLIVDGVLREKILIVIAQINLLICLVQDMLDYKMFEQGQFVTRKERFSPAETFRFVLSIFAQQA